MIEHVSILQWSENIKKSPSLDPSRLMNLVGDALLLINMSTLRVFLEGGGGGGVRYYDLKRNERKDGLLIL